MDDLRRYSRLAALPGIGPEGVASLNNATVGIVGCGALGSLCAMYLAASGVGTLRIADFDTIDISNLQRQLFFTEHDLGKPKALVLAQAIRQLNSGVRTEVSQAMITRSNVAEFFDGCDVIVDGSDNPDTKLMTDAASQKLGIPCVIAGVKEFECQIMTCLPDSRRYADVFGAASGSDFTPCSIGGVLGPAAGTAASLQAAETVKLLTGAGSVLANRLMVINLLSMTTNVFSL